MTAQDKINEAAGRAQSRSGDVALAIRAAVPQIARRLPAFLGDVAERYAAIAVGTVLDSPGLRACTPASIARGIIRAAEYGLALDGVLGHAYLVPYNVKGVAVAQFQLGYRGLVELMYRTGMWESITTDVVCVADAWEYRKGLRPVLDHTPALEGRGAPPGVSEGGTRRAAYAIAYPRGGGVPTPVVLGEEEILTRHRAASKAWRAKAVGNIWIAYPDVAWQKSALRELSKTVAMATDRTGEGMAKVLRQATVIDARIDRGDEDVIEVDGEPPPGEAVNLTTGEKV